MSEPAGSEGRLALAPESCSVAYISHARVPSRDANAVHVMKMVSALARVSRKRVVLLAQPGDDTLAADPFEFYGLAPSFTLQRVPLPWMRPRSLVCALKLGLKAVVQSVDVIVGRNIPGCTVAGCLGKPVVLEVHAPFERLSSLERLAFRRLVVWRRFCGLVTITEPLRQEYEMQFPSLAGRVHVLADAADESFQTIGGKTASIAGDFRVGYVGHLYDGRGVPLMLALAKHCPWADFHLVGGTAEDVAKWRRLGQGLANLHLHGFINPADVPYYRAQMDVLLAPYEQRVSILGQGDTSAWMSPLKLFEYMASRKAILCSDIPVLHEVMVDGRNCLMCPPGEVADWIAALSRLRTDFGLREVLATNAYEQWSRLHTWDARARRMLEIACGTSTTP